MAIPREAVPRTGVKTELRRVISDTAQSLIMVLTE